MEIHYQFFEDNNLLIHKFIGEFSIIDYEYYMTESTKQFEVNKVEKILTDLRNLEDSPIPDNIENLINELIRIREKVKLKSVKNIFIVEKPVAAAISSLYQNSQLSKGMDYSLCSTLDYAIKYLGLNYTVAELEEIIRNLKYKI